MRQLIVDLKAEYSGFRPHEIATICFLRFGRKLSDHTVKRVLADGPRPSVTLRRFPSYAQISDPYQRRYFCTFHVSLQEENGTAYDIC